MSYGTDGPTLESVAVEYCDLFSENVGEKGLVIPLPNAQEKKMLGRNDSGKAE